MTFLALRLLFCVSRLMSTLVAVEVLTIFLEEEVEGIGISLMGPGFSLLEKITFIGFAIFSKFNYTEGMVPCHQLESLPVRYLMM